MRQKREIFVYFLLISFKKLLFLNERKAPKGEKKKKKREKPKIKILDLQHQYNNCTTTLHMRVDSTHWGPPSCEVLLCSCCDDIVQKSNLNQK
jgi:hypothetical protein